MVTVTGVVYSTAIYKPQNYYYDRFSMLVGCLIQAAELRVWHILNFLRLFTSPRTITVAGFEFWLFTTPIIITVAHFKCWLAFEFKPPSYECGRF